MVSLVLEMELQPEKLSLVAEEVKQLSQTNFFLFFSEVV